MTPEEEMIRSVMCLLAADGTINTQEKQFLQQLCQRFNISGDVVRAAFQEVKQGKGHIAIPDAAKERKQLFGLLVQAAMADGTVGAPERKMLDTVAVKFGISVTAIDQYLATKKRSQATTHSSQKKPSLKKSQSPSADKSLSPPHLAKAPAANNEREVFSARTMTCPKCGIEQPEMSRCQECGIFIKTYLKQQQKEHSESSQDRMSILLYVPSGTLTLYALPFGAIMGLIAVAGVGWLYQLLVTWNPLIYFNALATLIYGVVIGRAVGLGLQLGKCRNILLGVVLAFIMAVIGDVLTFWYAYANIESVLAHVEIGWTISRFGLPFGIPLQGPAVYVFWLVELVLLCAAAMAAATIGPGEPFCEKCQQWTKKRHLGKISNINEDYLFKALQDGNLRPFLQPPPQASWKTVCYDLYSCPRCRQSRYLSVAIEWEEEGQREERVILDYALVSHEQLAELRDTLKQCRV